MVATGLIARRVTPVLVELEDARLVAVGSREAAKARAFADAFGAPAAYGDGDGGLGYERLAQDPNVDVAYVATPHGQHHEVVRVLLEAGKHVLVEKAFTINAAEADDLIHLAHDRGVFLMEAVWTRFLPVYQRALDVIASGAIGDVRWAQADLGFRAPQDPRSRMWAPEAGGGALLDLGVYAFTWAFAGLGWPASIEATGVVNDAGVDELTALTLGYPGGRFAQLAMTLVSHAPRTATLAGTEGSLRTHAPLTNPAGFTVERPDGVRREPIVEVAPAFAYMLREVTRCVQAGLTESPTMPLADTLATMRLFDQARAQMKVRYPNDAGVGTG